MIRELGVVFNEIDGNVSQIALNCHPYNLSHPTYCNSKNRIVSQDRSEKKSLQESAFSWGIKFQPKDQLKC